MRVSRRGLAAGAAIGGGLVVAWWLVPRSYPNPLSEGLQEHLFGPWLKIGEDGVVTLAVPQLEMGQGITTILGQVAAAELGADWRQIAIEPAPISALYANVPLAERWSLMWDPLVEGVSQGVDTLLATRFARDTRFMATADGTGLAAHEEPCRLAAASARAMLAMAAGERWGVGWEQCEVSGGLVRHDGRTATFGELASEAALQSAPRPPPLRPDPPGEEIVSGLAADIEGGAPPVPRIDLPSKIDGSHQFAADVRLPGMVYATIRHGPGIASELSSFDASGAARVPGVAGIVRSKRWLAVAADTWWSANRALDAMKPEFTTAYPVESADMTARLGTMLTGGASYPIASRGLGEEGMTQVDFARRYEVEPAFAAPIETASAAARYRDGRLELWIASQAPEQARRAAARALGLAAEDVVLYPVSAGGSFDARLEYDHAIEIALIARELGKPVQLTWPRRDEFVRARPRPPAWMLIGAQLGPPGGGASGAIDALRVRIACPSTSLEFGRRLFAGRTAWAAISETSGQKDALACEGAVPPYAVPSLHVEHVPVEIGLPTGRVRGNAHSYTAFAIESFIDEVASANNREPLSYRISMLGQDLRMAACLQRAAALAEWGGGGDASGQGLACHRMGEAPRTARIACIATARRAEGGVRVTRLSVAVDIGRIVNRDIARQQIEGGLIFGIATALGNAPRYRAGMPSILDLEGLALPTLGDCPEIEIDLIASDAPPADPGELGAIIAPPAIANALFSATGLRLRRLPLLSGGL